MKRFSFLLYLTLFLSVYVYSQQCNRDVIDCKGICGRMTDADGDSICDLSPRSVSNKSDLQLNNIEKTDETIQKSKTKNIVSKNDKSISSCPNNDLAQNSGCNKSGCSGCGESQSDTIQHISTPIPDKVPTNNKPETAPKADVYPLIEISSLTLGLYLLTWLLAKFKIFKTSVHRKIWNVVLAITFLMSGVLGLVLVVQLNYNVLNDWYLSFLKLHVDFGISMGLISIFHILWHTKYFLTLFKKPKTAHKN